MLDIVCFQILRRFWQGLLHTSGRARYQNGMILSQSFYARDTIQVAEGLLGKRLVRVLDSGERIAGRIVEVEAYLGVDDPAAHTFGGRRTARNEAMYGDAGFAYVYFIYGIHHCVNVVTQSRDIPEAVLLRALEPVEGFSYFEKSFTSPPEKWLNGPGKLCAGLGVTRFFNAVPLFHLDSKLFIEDDISVSLADIQSDRRVGVDYAGDASFWPLRLGIRGSRSLSPPKFE
jgi:DNA-3-methyladenine glycosylase